MEILLTGLVVATFCYLQFFPPPYHVDGIFFSSYIDSHFLHLLSEVRLLVRRVEDIRVLAHVGGAEH